VEGSYTSLPFGDAYAASGSDADPYHYAQLDYDSETNSDHAQFRQYSSTQGRWMRPDPYYGSYDFTNPQSFNRYAYGSNNPLASVDPLGLDVDDGGDDGGDPGDGGEGWGGGYGGFGGDYTYGANPYPPGTILQDQYGNVYIVNPDGSITPFVGTTIFVDSDGGSTCDMSTSICQVAYQQITTQFTEQQLFVIQYNRLVSQQKKQDACHAEANAAQQQYSKNTLAGEAGIGFGAAAGALLSSRLPGGSPLTPAKGAGAGISAYVGWAGNDASSHILHDIVYDACMAK